MNDVIYLDYAASAPPYDEVYPHMNDIAGTIFGNPSSLHSAGSAARHLLRQSRSQLSALLGVQPQEVIFTSGGTESNNTALFSVLNGSRRSVVLAATEHPSVLRAARRLKQQGFSVTFVPPDAQGRILPEAVRRALTRDTALVSVHAVNNETGVIQDMAALSEAAHSVGALFHCDAVQAFGHVALPFSCADMVSLSGHKFGGPHGVGVLTVRDCVPFSPLILGGSQELSRRAGTENVPGIAAFAAAADRAQRSLPAESARQKTLADTLLARMQKEIPGLMLHSSEAPRVPGLLSLHFPGAAAEEMQVRLNEAGVCVGVGAACASADASPSHVLTAMGLSVRETKETLRLSFGWATAEEDILAAAEAITRVYKLCKK